MGIQVTKKVGIGKFVAPLWAVGLTGAALAAVAGTAVGPVLAGSVSGTVGATIEQTVVLTGASVTNEQGDFAATVEGADDSVGVINDEGTNFTVAIETQVGQNQTIELGMENNSGQDANVLLELNVPAGLDVEVDMDNGDEAQLSANKWLISLASGAGSPDGAGEGNTVDTLYINVEPKDDLKPGFYTITGRIVQIAG